jgi:hypothetical protein
MISLGGNPLAGSVRLNSPNAEAQGVQLSAIPIIGRRGWDQRSAIGKIILFVSGRTIEATSDNRSESGTGPRTGRSDFADVLSPMMVKELRQGLRGWAFIGAFLLLQFTLIIVVLMGLEETGDHDYTGYFWLGIAATFCGLLPLRSVGALSDEMKAGALDLLMVTRLSASRIAFGKWASMAAQTVLFAISLLPYVVLRYFAGGIDPVHELTGLAWLIALSLLFTAYVVWISAAKNLLARLLLASAGGFAIWRAVTWVCQGIVDPDNHAQLLLDWSASPGVTAPGSPAALTSAVSLPLTVVGLAALIYLFLEFAASQIAPLAENHAARKRLAAGLLVVGMLAVYHFFTLSKNLIGVPITIALVAGMDALSESLRTIPIVYRPFVKRGWLGRLAGRLLEPGWPSGVIFLSVLAGVTLAVLMRRQWVDISTAVGLLKLRLQTGWRYVIPPDPLAAFSFDPTVLVVCSTLTTLFVPVPILLLAPARTANFRFRFYLIVILVISLIGGALSFQLDRVTPNPWLMLTALTPLSGLIASIKSSNWLTPHVMRLSAFSGFCWWLAALLCAARAFARIRPLEFEAASLDQRGS